MDTDSRAQTSTDGGRSGGKIVKRRRYATARTPYDRPPPPPPENSGSNWFTGLVLPTATRIIGKGATKLVSLLTDTNSPSSSSTDAEDEDEDEDNAVSCDDDNDVSFEKDSASMEMIDRKELQFLPETSPKKVIEKLLSHESFSREESDKLVEIIKSRVVDFSTMKGQGTGLAETPSRIFDTPDRCGKPVMEATHLLEEKKAGSGSKSDVEHGFSGFSHHLTEFDKGSPVDVAKSYMQARSAWASPSIWHSGLKTPTPMAMDLFKDDNLLTVDSSSLPSAKKRDTLSAGSWNIQDEIRKVRTKATEDMLRDLPSTRIDLSSFTLEPKTFQDVPDNGGNGDKVQSSNPLPEDASVNLAASIAFHDFTDTSALGGMKQDGLQTELVSSNPPTSIFEPNQDLKSHQIVEEGTTTDSHHSISLEHLLKQQNANVTNLKDDIGNRGAPNANGAASRSSLSAGIDTEQNPNQSGENEIHPDGSIGNKPTKTMSEEEACGFLSEPSIEIRPENEINSTADDSEDLQDSAHQVDADNGTPGEKGLNEKQPEKKRGRNQRKGRGKLK